MLPTCPPKEDALNMIFHIAREHVRQTRPTTQVSGPEFVYDVTCSDGTWMCMVGALITSTMARCGCDAV